MTKKEMRRRIGYLEDEVKDLRELLLWLMQERGVKPEPTKPPLRLPYYPWRRSPWIPQPWQPYPSTDPDWNHMPWRVDWGDGTSSRITVNGVELHQH